MPLCAILGETLEVVRIRVEGEGEEEPWRKGTRGT
jgi:hypothetical protein